MIDLDHLYAELHGPVRAFLAALVRDDAVADDLAQDVFVRARQKLDTLDDPARVKPWLFQIARNRAVDHFRSAAVARRRDADPERLQSLADQGAPGLIGAIAPAPLQQAEQREMSDCVQEKLSALSEEQRTVLTLFDVVGLSHREIGEVLGVSEGTAKVRLHRARAAARELLTAACDFVHDERNVLVCVPRDDGPADPD